MNVKTFIPLAFLLMFHCSNGQSVDSLNTIVPLISIDSTKQSLLNYSDSIYTIQIADSIQKKAHHQLDSGISVLNNLIDSLNATVNSPGQYQVILGDLFDKFDSTFLAPLKSKGDSISAGLKERVDHLQNALEKKKDFIDSVLTVNQFASIQDLKLDAKIPEMSFGSQDMPPLPLDQLKLPGINGLDLPAVDFDISNPLSELENSMSKVGDTANELKEYSDEISKVRQGDMASMDKVRERIEKQLLDIKELNALEKGSASISKFKKEAESMTDKIKDEDKLKEEVVKRSKKEFVDHFAGHEEKIDSEIKSMEKLQRKYHSVTDVRYLPKGRTNPEKGKPFVERLIIGTEFQIDRKDPKWTGMDVSPYLGYKFSDRFRMCVGGTYRITFDPKTFEFSQQNKVFGYRAFANYRIFNGWFAHLEAEALKMKTPPAYTQLPVKGNDAEGSWIPMAYFGIFKTFGISKHFQGQTQILYNFLDVDENFNFNKFAFRFGFEYKIIKKKK